MPRPLSMDLRARIVEAVAAGASCNATAVERLILLTRDVGRYRSYFPTVELIISGA